MRPFTASSNDVQAIVKSFCLFDNISTNALIIKGALHASHSGKNDGSTDVHHNNSVQPSLRAPTHVVNEGTDIHDDIADNNLLWAKQLGREARARVEWIDVGRVNDNSR